MEQETISLAYNKFLGITECINNIKPNLREHGSVPDIFSLAFVYNNLWKNMNTKYQTCHRKQKSPYLPSTGLSNSFYNVFGQTADNFWM